MKLVAPLWYFWSSIWSWCHYFSSSVNTSMIKKRERLWRGKSTEKTQPFRREDEASVNDEVHRVSLIGPWKPTWLWRQQSCQGQNQRTTPVNIWQWIELSFKWKKKKKSLESIRAGPSPDSRNWIWEMIWGCSLCWWRNNMWYRLFLENAGSLAFDTNTYKIFQS